MRAGIRSDICSVLTPCGPKGWQAGELSGGVEEAGDEAGKEGRTSLRQNYRSSPGRCGSKKTLDREGLRVCMQVYIQAHVYTCTMHIHVHAHVYIYIDR